MTKAKAKAPPVDTGHPPVPEKAGQTIDELLASITPAEAVAFMPMDGIAMLDLERRMAEQAQARQAGDTETVEGLDEEITALAGRVKASMREFRLRVIGHRAWQQLVREHPPTKHDRAKRLDHCPDTFWPAALAAMLVDPAMTVEQVGELGNRMSAGQWAYLVGVARQLETGVPRG